MKTPALYLATCALLVASTLTTLAVPSAQTVSTNSVTVLPGRPILGATTWTNGISLAQGQVVKHSGTYYMAETAGTSTNTPIPGTITGILRHVTGQLRDVALVQNLGSTDVFLSFDGPAVANKGLKLVPGAVVSLDDVQGPVHAVTASGSTTVGTSEVVQ